MVSHIRSLLMPSLVSLFFACLPSVCDLVNPRHATGTFATTSVHRKQSGTRARLHVGAREEDAGREGDHDHVVRHRIEVVEPDAIEGLARQVDCNQHILPRHIPVSVSSIMLDHNLV